MKKLILKQEGDWIAFRTTNTVFVNCVKSGVTPVAYRKYDSANRQWLVHHTKGKTLLGLASRFYTVDRGELPLQWQLLMAGGKASNKTTPTPEVGNSPYAVLYLLDNAPLSVVKVVYKTLLLEYHPDHNDGVGDKDRLQEIIVAYRKITSKNH
jgi:hypothetical protein